MDPSKREAIDSFCSITGAGADRALFFLESSDYEVDRAIAAFFDSGGGEEAPAHAAINDADDDDGPEEVSAPAPRAAGVRAGQGAWPGTTGGAGGSSSRPRGSSNGPRPRGAGGIATLSDLNNRAAGSGSDSDDGPQEYYTGGEKSGMLVQDPTKPPRNNVDNIFEKARDLGAREGTLEDLQPAQASDRRAFTGTGYTLAGEPKPVEETPVEEGPPAPLVHTITFWTNGFTVNDGPLRTLDDPANRPFLQSIEKGECPKELEPPNRKTPIHVNLVRQERDWKPPPEPKYRAFSGTGRTLASSSGADGASSSAPVTADAVPRTGFAAGGPERGLIVDESKPFTSIQLRLQDGTRMVARFNHHHTVGDIRAFIDNAQPGGPSRSYLLVTAFPPKQLNDPSQTIEQAGIVNAVVIQKA